MPSIGEQDAAAVVIFRVWALAPARRQMSALGHARRFGRGHSGRPISAVRPIATASSRLWPAHAAWCSTGGWRRKKLTLTCSDSRRWT